MEEENSFCPMEDYCALNIVLQWFYKASPISCRLCRNAFELHFTPRRTLERAQCLFVLSLFRVKLFALWTDRSAPWSVRDS